jgi:hypothetical protein
VAHEGGGHRRTPAAHGAGLMLLVFRRCGSSQLGVELITNVELAALISACWGEPSNGPARATVVIDVMATLVALPGMIGDPGSETLPSNV